MNKKNLILGLVMALSIAGIYLLQFEAPFTVGGGEYTVCISDSVTGNPVQGVDIKCSVTLSNGLVVRDIDSKTGAGGCASFSAYDVESWSVQWIWKSGYVDYDYPGTISGDVYSTHILAHPPQVTTTLPAPTTSTTTTTTMPLPNCDYRDGWVTLESWSCCYAFEFKQYVTTCVSVEYRDYSPSLDCDVYVVTDTTNGLRSQFYEAYEDDVGIYCSFGCQDGVCVSPPSPPEPDNIIQVITQWIQDIISYFMDLIN